MSYVPLKLPSKCKVYDGVDPSQLEIRVLKGKDEKLIAEMTYDNLEEKFLVVLRNVIKGIDPIKLTLGDRKFVLVWLGINSYSKDFPVDVICDTCLQKITVNVDLAQFEVKELPDDFVQPYEVNLSEGKVYLRLLTVEDEIKVANYEKSGANSWLYRYALTIVDPEKSTADKVNMLEEMEAKDLAKIRAFHEKFDHGPIMEADYICPKCGGRGRMAVPFRIEMVFPYGRTLKEHFGKTV